jgi:hypothetical protein
MRAAGCRLFELDHARDRSRMLCAVVEYNSLKEFALAGDAWFANDARRTLIERMRTNRPSEAAFSWLFTRVTPI